MSADEARRVGEEVGLAPTVSAGESDVASTLKRTIENTGEGDAGGAAATSTPATMGRYRIVRRIGAGGMGVVYEGHDPELDRPVAIKVLRERAGARARLAERLHREARALARVTHPNVVSVYDVGVDDAGVYVVMQYVAGETLEAALARERPDARTVLARFDAAGRGLAAAHAAELVHRDFKPSNVLIDADGTVRVTDFGLARVSDLAEAPDAVGGELGASMTRGELVGTPAYMAPEQFRGGPITAATDQFSFCVALWQALCGARPFAGASVDELRASVLAGAVVAPREPMPRRIEAVLRRGLAIDPPARHPSMNALLTALAPRRGARAAVVIGLGLAGAAAIAVAVTREPARAPSPPAGPPPPLPLARGPGAPPVLITRLGGCAYAPAFAGDDTVVFDLTRDETVDLYRVDLGGGEPVRLTSDKGWEWRAAPGATRDEVLFLRQGGDVTGVEALDLASGTRRTITGVSATAVFASGAYYLAPAKGPALQRLSEGRQEIFIPLPAGRTANMMIASPDGSRLGVLFQDRNTPPQLCTVPIARPDFECLSIDLIGSRPAFSSDSSEIYVDRSWRVDRVAQDGTAATVLPDIEATGGIAVAPGGGAMVYSDCNQRPSLQDVGVTPPVAIDESRVIHPGAGPRNVIAYVRMRPRWRALVVRHADGSAEELLARDKGRLSAPAFNADSSLLVYLVRGVPEAGIHLVPVGGRSAPNRLTEGATDERPVFAGDRVAFTRRDADGSPQLMTVGLDGADEQRVSPRPRITVGADLTRGRVLLVAPAYDHLYWWDPRTGKESSGPKLPDKVTPSYLALSPNGAWLMALAGNNGQDVWRIPVAGGAPERVYRLATGVTAAVGTIDDRGHPLIEIDAWTGELWLARRAEGSKW